MSRTIVNIPNRKALLPKDIQDKEKFESNWDAIFGKKPVAPEPPLDKADQLPPTIGVNT